MDAELEDLLIFPAVRAPIWHNPLRQSLKWIWRAYGWGGFADGENFAELLVNVRGKNVFIIQSICRPANDNLMELMLIGDAARRSSAANIVAVAPYWVTPAKTVVHARRVCRLALVLSPTC